MKKLLLLALVLIASITMKAQPAASGASYYSGTYFVPDGNGAWLVIPGNVALSNLMDTYATSSSMDWTGLKSDLSSPTPVGIALSLYNSLVNYIPTPSDFTLGGPSLCCGYDGIYCWSYNCSNCDCSPDREGGVEEDLIVIY